MKAIFRNKKPEEIYDLLAHKIVLNTLLYRKEFDIADKERSPKACEEILYFLVHMLDREAFNLLGSNKRNEIYDEIYKRVIYNYCKAVIKKDSPEDVIPKLAIEMINKLNERQTIYGKCKSIFGDGLPSKGSAIFALSFFIHKALGKTNRDDVYHILIGENDLTKNDLVDFPEFDFILVLATSVGGVIKNINYPKILKKLK